MATVSINATTSIETDQLVDKVVSELSNEELINFVIDLEKRAQDWDFTKKLHNFFTTAVRKSSK